MNIAAAEILSLRVITHIIGDDNLCDSFLAQSGARHDILKELINSRAFQVAALDFLTQNDAWILAFCDAGGEDPENLMRARHLLAPDHDFT